MKRHGLKPGVIKIDAENFEAEVMIGAEQTICLHAPAVIMETGSAAALQAGSYLVAHDYKIFVSESGGSLSHWQASLDSANTRFKDILFVPPSRMEDILGSTK